LRKKARIEKRGKRWRKGDLERKKRRTQKIKEERDTQARGRLISKS